MNGSSDSVPEEAVDLQLEVKKRRTWFYECQLRSLNFQSFRYVTEVMPIDPDPDAFPNRLIDLISKTLRTWGFPAGQMSGLEKLGQVYLDSQEPVWTADEISRRDKFAQTFIGWIDNWLGYKSGKRLADELRELKKQYEASAFASQIDLSPDLNLFGRRHPGHWPDPADPPFGQRPGRDMGAMGLAISRAMLAETKPWLIPELYNGKNHDSMPIEKWIENLEAFIGNFEADLSIAVGGTPGQQIPADPMDGKAYRAWIKFLIEASSTRSVSDSLKAKMLTEIPNPDGKSFTYRYEDIHIKTAGYPMGPLNGFLFCDSVKYWTGVVQSALGQVYVNKPNADMGLCHIMRIVYLLGTLPASLGAAADLAWRKRSAPDDTFAAFFAKKGEDPVLKDNEALRKRFQSAQNKLQVILDETAAHPHSAAPTFSPLAQEIIRQALHSFKFWMDEPFRVSSNEKLLNARKQTKIVTSDHEQEAEMEYWSENHYIMFASSEFLAGQLWESDEFQPGKEFLGANSKVGILTGKERKERGKARVLKWLNNRLMFGWTEFHSSGYYREHLWALLNLVDFSLDREVRDKATLVVDLMLFDVVRFLHKGTMAAPGGRCQFKSKNCGWDNALGDVVEILFGSRGIFSDGNAEIGASMASSTYKAPDVLLEIGTHPPMTPFTDRSRVSITFEEAPKYGIGYSLKSDQRDSVMMGYAPKLALYFPFIDSVNTEIARTHSGYGATEDDTIFWWGASAFFNKQIVRGTFRCAEKFALEKCPIFDGAVPKMIKLILMKEVFIGGLIGGIAAGPVGFAVGGGIGYLTEILDPNELEDASDDLSVFLEGSTRTRANILSFRTPDIMLSSIQNFRPGQVNFQSSVSQASINPSSNVFTTAGLEDIDISDLDAAIGGFLALGPLGAGAAVILNESKLKHKDLGFVDHDDGPGWWTGSWALPMVVQHGSAAILAYSYYTIQKLLAQCGSHVWFPKAGFDRVDEVRTSAYDNADFALLDIGDIGPKGFWLFGKIIHPAEGTKEPREAYIGVFSNQRPEWLDQGSALYKRLINKSVREPIIDAQKKIDDLLGEIGFSETRATLKAAVVRAVDGAYRPNINQGDWEKGAIAALSHMAELDFFKPPLRDYRSELAKLEINLKILQRTWPDPLPLDYFANRDWYVEDKNVWIIQVGTKAEFGDFQTFKDRVSSARIHLDDAGDMECTYDIPKGDGSSERLRLAYGDGGQFELNGKPFQTDLYPRFENPFLRSGRVEWGQREYVIEYRGKSLLHDFSDFSKPLRSENFISDAKDRNTVKALVIFVKTHDEEMEEFTVATATVRIGCTNVTMDQVIAAGPVDEDTLHDAEWIFFDAPSLRNPDMTISLSHATPDWELLFALSALKGDATPDWEMSFTLRALMGDRTLRECSLSSAYFNFEDEKRQSAPFPFTVALSEWRPWEPIENNRAPKFWMIARHPEFTKHYYDYNDLLVLDQNGRLWHRRLMSCPAAEKGWFPVSPGGGKGPDLGSWFSASAVSAQPGTLFLLVQSKGNLFASWASPSGAWSADWTTLDVYIYPDLLLLGLPDTGAAQIPIALDSLSAVAAVPSLLSADGAEVFVLAADGHFYSHPDWRPNSTGPWRKLDVSGFSPLLGADFVVVGDFLLVLAGDRTLWATALDHSPLHRVSTWESLTTPDLPISQFSATCENGICQIVATTTAGGTWATSYSPGNPPAWVELNLPEATISPTAPLTSTVPSMGHAQFFAADTDGKFYTIGWESAVGWSASRQWSAVEPGSQVFVRRGGMAAISRVKGQIELFAQGTDGELFKAWWS